MTQKYGVKTVLARDEGISTLFRYMQYPPLSDITDLSKERRTWVENVLTQSEIYFPLVPQFNDPFEGSPHFRIPRRADGSIDTDVYISNLHEYYGPKWGWSQERMDESAISLLSRVRDGTFEAETAIIEEQQLQWIRKDFPICCLSKDRENIPMWSYYAGSHTGICIHLDARIAPFGAAMKVVYENEYPVIPMPAAQLEPLFVIQQLLLTKSEAWRHEAEYRLVDMPNTETGVRTLASPVATMVRPQVYRFLPRHFVGITCGAKMTDAAIGRIVDICARRSPRLPVYRAQTLKHKFGLAFERLRF